MKEFNAQLPENHAIRSFFEPKKCLIISPLQMIRVMARKLAGNIGILPHNIDMVNNFPEAQKLLKEKKHEIIFSEYYLGNRNSLDMVVDADDNVEIVQFDGKNKYGLDLLEIHKEIYPNRLNSIFVIISDYNSQNVAYKCFENEVELFLTKPLSYENFEKGFLQTTEKKLYADETMKELENVKLYMAKGEFSMAHQVLDLIKDHNLSSADLFYYEGMIYRKENKLDNAITALTNAYQQDNKHYLALCLLFDTLYEAGRYQESFEYSKVLTQQFPINPSRLPTLVKVSLANKQYEEVAHYCQIFMDLDDKDPEISKQLSAGLIVSGRILAEAGEKERAILNLKKAAEFCEGEKRVLMSSLENMLLLKAHSEMRKVLLKIKEDKRMDNDYEVMNLKLILSEEDFGGALTGGLKMINEGVKSPEVYGVCLDASISIGRRRDAIQEILENAIKAFPEHKKFFEEKLKNTA